MIIALAVVLALTACGSRDFGDEVAALEVQDAEASRAEAPADAAAISLMKQRIALLERALGAQTPEQAVRTWAEARRTRNGAMEFAVLDPATRDRQLATFEELNWVTGVSSPWIARYRIGKGVKQADGGIRYPVQFDYRTSTDADKPVDWSKIKPVFVSARKGDPFWYVTEQ